MTNPKRSTAITRRLSVLVLLAGAGLFWVLASEWEGRYGPTFSLAGVLALCAALIVGLRPWHQAWPLLVPLVLVFWAGTMLYKGSNNFWSTLMPIILLVGAGSLIAAMLRRTASWAIHDLDGASRDRHRAIDDLEHQLTWVHGPGLREISEALEKAAGSSDDKVAERARTLLDVYAPLLDAVPHVPEEELPPETPEDLAGLPQALAPGAVRVVAEAEGDAQSEIDGLVDLLREGDPAACAKAVDRLVEIGEDAIPALEIAAAEGDADVRIDAMRALRVIRGETP